MEAISPTGPDSGIMASSSNDGGRGDELRSTKDDLLQRIAKVDREIAKAESQIAKLKKKQQELESAANKVSTNDQTEVEEEKPKSRAQVIYAENRVIKR